MRASALLAGIVMLGLSCQALAWSNHSLGSLLALRDLPSLSEPVTVEPLEAFLGDQAPAIEQLLDEQELYAREHFAYYPPRPDALRWRADGSGDRRAAFLAALRINPEIRLASFIQQLPGQPADERPVLASDQVLVFRKVGPWTHWRYLALQPGEQVAALQVLASAADEPDYGHDINLFSDNPGEAGQRYNFGPQPFGDARFEYSSQAPFHIGYYHESALVYAAAPYLGQTLPHWRIYQYTGLARLAFDSGHDYWGYRFLGWAMHYLQDLTQPYHSRVLPGVDLAGMVLIEAKAQVGLSEDREAAIKRVADRHTAVEQYQFERMQNLLGQGQLHDPMLTAYAEQGNDSVYPDFDVNYAAKVVAVQSNARADEFDAQIGRWLARGAASQGFSKGNQLLPVKTDPALDALLIEFFQHFGSHTRNALKGTHP